MLIPMIDREQVVRLRRLCWSCSRISSEVGATPQRVFQILRTDFPGHTRWVRNRIQTWADRLRAKHPGLPQSEIRKIVCQAHKTRCSVQVARAVPPYLRMQVPVLELRCQGMLQRDIALCLGIRQQMVSRALLAAEVRSAPLKRGATRGDSCQQRRVPNR